MQELIKKIKKKEDDSKSLKRPPMDLESSRGFQKAWGYIMSPEMENNRVSAI